MDDQSRQPRDADRSPLRSRIKRAVADGRISAADGDIRLRNVDSAQSIGELGLIVRDLDQLEASIAPSPVASTTPATQIQAAAQGSAQLSGRRWLPVLVTVLVLGVLGAAGGALFVFSSGGDSGTASGPRLADPVPITEEPEVTDRPADEPSDPPAHPAYGLTPQGVRTFIATYRQRFRTTRAITATFYGDYVVVQVPVAGTTRHTGWVYRQASGFTDFGPAGANFPGSAAVDLGRLNVPALFRNIARAKRVLHVAGSNQTYVNIDYRPQFDPAPNVNIYLSNKFNESGYLATRLDGQVERAFPFNAG